MIRTWFWILHYNITLCISQSYFQLFISTIHDNINCLIIYRPIFQRMQLYQRYILSQMTFSLILSFQGSRCRKPYVASYYLPDIIFDAICVFFFSNKKDHLWRKGFKQNGSHSQFFGNPFRKLHRIWNVKCKQKKTFNGYVVFVGFLW